MRVPGFHGANDQETCLDWLDIQFGRSDPHLDQQSDVPVGFRSVADSARKETVDLSRYPRHVLDG